MVDHLKLLVGFICLLIGAGVSVYLYLIYKRSNHSYIQSIFQYSIYQLLLFIGFLISRYFEFNIAETELVSDITTYKNIGALIITLLQLGMIYFLIITYIFLIDKDIPRLLNRFSIFIVVVLVISYVTKLILANFDIHYLALNKIHDMAWRSTVYVETLILIVFYFYRKPSLSVERIKMARGFLYIYLARFPVIILLTKLFSMLNSEIIKVIYPLIFIMPGILAPLVWIKLYYEKYIKDWIAKIKIVDGLKLLSNRYSISNREQDILKLLLEGKTNRDIAETLFIAVPTVKNHLYKIYQKIGVKTRFELIHHVANFSED